MASTNPFLTIVSTVQTNLVGSTITTGFIPYISTAGRQTYSNTLSTLTVSTLSGTNVSFPIVNTSTINASTMNTPTVNTTTVNTTTVNTTNVNATSIGTNSITFPSGYTQNSSALGYNQSYSQPSRSLGTTYTNSTGRPIFVLVSLNGNAGSTTSFLARGYVNDVQIWLSYASGSYNPPVAGYAVTTVYLIVPAGSTYRITTEQIWGANGYIASWAELS